MRHHAQCWGDAHRHAFGSLPCAHKASGPKPAFACFAQGLLCVQDMPEKYIYEPWTAPEEVQRKANCIIGKDYPRPLVDHATKHKVQPAGSVLLLARGSLRPHALSCCALCGVLQICLDARLRCQPLHVAMASVLGPWHLDRNGHASHDTLLPGLPMATNPDAFGAGVQENLDRIKACYDAAKDPSKPTVTKHHEQVSKVKAANA